MATPIVAEKRIKHTQRRHLGLHTAIPTSEQCHKN